jgi:hypothetical protein
VKPKRALFAARWVHVFEEDGPEGQVYRPETGSVPLSRRPRQRVSFARDGSACVVVQGPDDRLHEIAARWTETDGEVTVTPQESSPPVTRGSSRAAPTTFSPLRFKVAAKDRLVLQRATTRTAG